MPPLKKYRCISYLLSEETGKHVAEDALQPCKRACAPKNTQQRVPGNNQTPNNAVIALVISDVLPLSCFHNKSLPVRPRLRRCGAGGSLPQPANTKLCYWRLRGAQCLLMPPPVSALILEMFSVANKSVMRSHTCSICKWIALAHIASDGNQQKKKKKKTLKRRKKMCARRRWGDSHTILSVIVWIVSDADVLDTL